MGTSCVIDLNIIEIVENRLYVFVMRSFNRLLMMIYARCGENSIRNNITEGGNLINAEINLINEQII